LFRVIKRVGAGSNEVRKCADFLDHAERGLTELLDIDDQEDD
jgi:hypothetical protein